MISTGAVTERRCFIAIRCEVGNQMKPKWCGFEHSDVTKIAVRRQHDAATDRTPEFGDTVKKNKCESSFIARVFEPQQILPA